MKPHDYFVTQCAIKWTIFISMFVAHWPYWIFLSANYIPVFLVLTQSSHLVTVKSSVSKLFTLDIHNSLTPSLPVIRYVLKLTCSTHLSWANSCTNELELNPMR